MVSSATMYEVGWTARGRGEGRRVGKKICAGLAGSRPEEEGRWA